MVVLGTLVVILSLVIPLFALYGMGRRHPIGDEAEYLGGAGLHDSPVQPFLRMPLLPWLVASCKKAGIGRLRLVLVLLSVPTVVMTGLAGWYLGGGLLAILSSSLLLLQPERILLACHVWPDSLLSLAIAAIALLLVLPGVSSVPLLLALGLVCALGSLVRIDFLVVPVAVWGSLLSSGRAADGVSMALLLVPTLLVVVSCAFHNFRRHGLFTPDNTWTLNLMISKAETERQTDSVFALDPIIDETFSRWHAVPSTQRSHQALQGFAKSLLRPVPFLRGVVRRFLTLCGPDTFFREKVLPGAYPDLNKRARQGMDFPLRVAFPLLITLTVIGLILRREFPAPFAWPALSLMAVATLFFARTRIRVALLPAFSLLAGQGLIVLAGGVHSFSPVAIVLLVSAPFMLWALMQIRCSRELPTQDGAV